MAAPPVPSIDIYDRKLPVVASDLILLHLRGFLRKPVDATDIYFLEAVGDETAVRGRGAKALRDVRSLGEVVPPEAGATDGIDLEVGLRQSIEIS